MKPPNFHFKKLFKLSLADDTHFARPGGMLSQHQCTVSDCPHTAWRRIVPKLCFLLVLIWGKAAHHASHFSSKCHLCEIPNLWYTTMLLMYSTRNTCSCEFRVSRTLNVTW